ncbi:unnamed protein product [Schistosoma curassoni]|uniref:CBS domain-containing protein n=1 Tax=Schistosoma curassoni TaxID=6186 RepID=A0A183KAW4_9TREM|nr:unnamed protein product [Schistosoma curassoni]
MLGFIDQAEMVLQSKNFAVPLINVSELKYTVYLL